MALDNLPVTVLQGEKQRIADDTVLLRQGGKAVVMHKTRPTGVAVLKGFGQDLIRREQIWYLVEEIPDRLFDVCANPYLVGCCPKKRIWP